MWTVPVKVRSTMSSSEEADNANEDDDLLNQKLDPKDVGRHYGECFMLCQEVNC